MDRKLLEEWFRLRVSIGFLGEGAQYDWWPTKFYADWSSTFLDPIFPKTVHMARYHGVSEAGRRVHDSFIGVGSVFHLFRLPEEIERSFHELAEAGETVKFAEELTDSSSVLTSILGDKSPSTPRAEGPCLIGSMADVFSKGGLAQVSARYVCAFVNGTKVYPYFSTK